MRREAVEKKKEVLSPFLGYQTEKAESLKRRKDKDVRGREGKTALKKRGKERSGVPRWMHRVRERRKLTFPPCGGVVLGALRAGLYPISTLNNRGRE